MDKKIKNCAGYQKLLAAIKHDEETSPGWHNYRKKLDWIVVRVMDTAEKTGLDPCAILCAWEEHRNYWYMNYYQESNQPLIDSPDVRVFNNTDEFIADVGEYGFRCPVCKGVSPNPFACQIPTNDGEDPCDWTTGGLFTFGSHVFLKDKMRSANILTPVAWEVVESR